MDFYLAMRTPSVVILHFYTIWHARDTVKSDPRGRMERGPFLPFLRLDRVAEHSRTNKMKGSVPETRKVRALPRMTTWPHGLREDVVRAARSRRA